MTTCIKTNTLLKAENIQLVYDNKVILRDINFCIKDIVRPAMQQGQVISLVGRSGIGKTQLFKIVSGLQKSVDVSMDGVLAASRVAGTPHKLGRSYLEQLRRDSP